MLIAFTMNKLPAMIANDENVSLTQTTVSSVSAKVSHFWTIENFKSLFPTHTGEAYIESDKFFSYVPNVGRFEWRLRLFPFCSNHVSVTACVSGSSNFTLSTNINYTVVDSNNGTILGPTVQKHVFALVAGVVASPKCNLFQPYYDPGTNTFNLSYAPTMTLPDGTFRLVAEISFNAASLKTARKLKSSTSASATHIGESKMRLFGSLFNSGKFSDFIVEAGGKEFPAHRAILGARSSYFEKLLESNMKETKEGRLVVQEFSSDAVQVMLAFIYTDELEEPWSEHAVELLRLGDMYDLPKLKEAAEARLCSTVDEKNVYKLLLLADSVGATSLKDATVDLILRRFRNFRETPEWKKFRREHLAIACQVLEQEKG